MKRAALVLGLISLVWLVGACSGGSTDDPNPDAGPLLIKLLWAEPSTGASPLRVVFTANITGGIEPYYYSWDFTNDGSTDTYLNGEFRRTVSVDNSYYWRASDAGGLTIYNAVLKVTDSVGTTVISDPIQVNVLGTVGITVNAETRSDETTIEPISGNLVYIYRSGEPVYYYASPTGGAMPYSYHWDFDNDGVVDSTVINPQHTYTYTGAGARPYVWKVEVVDANGERVSFLGAVDVQGEQIGPDPAPPFDIRVNSDPPADDDGVIRLEFDPTGGNINVPTEPELDLAVVVTTTQGGGGAPPFEYYWDFETDGALDSQALSPTIPYYDTERLIMINPYMHDQSTKTFLLTCMVIDSTGRSEKLSIPVEVNSWSGLDPIQVNYQYGIAAADAFAAIPPEPFAKVDGRSSLTSVLFDFNVSGSAGRFEFQFDMDGDGNPDVVEIDKMNNTDGSAGPDGVFDEMVNNWYKAPDGDILFKVGYAGVDYFATNVKVRSVDNSGNEVSGKQFECPVSLVKREELTGLNGDTHQVEFDFGVPAPRRDHCIVADWTTQAFPINVRILTEREILIIGGRQGTAVLDTVEHVLQTYNPPEADGLLETLASTVDSSRAPLNQERHSSVVWAQGPENGAGAVIRIHAGANERNGLLVSNEQSTGGGGVVTWSVLSEMLIPDYYPLKDMAGTFIEGLGYVMAGGLHKPTEEVNLQASRQLLVYDPMFDSYGKLTQMGLGRYDASIAFTNDHIYIIGGREANGGSVATVEAYDPVTNMWETYNSQMLEPRSGAACQVIGGMVYVIGGAYWPPNESEPVLLDTAEVFNPFTGVWSPTLPLPTEAGKKVMADGVASVAVPGPGSVLSGGAVINGIVTFGGEGYDEEIGTQSAELSRMYEFTYFYEVPLPEVPAP